MEQNYNTASALERISAVSIDAMIALTIDFVARTIAGLLYEPLSVLGFICAAVFYVCRDLLNDTRSPGKRLLDLKIVDYDTGKPISHQQALRRNIIFGICFFSFGVLQIPKIGWFLSLFLYPMAVVAALYEIHLWYKDEEWRRWGDELAGTIVISPHAKSIPQSDPE